ncbi:MAG: N-acetyl-gamma-glutamyl-phosphate reductase [Thermodesulfobacteriota bacterium]
MSSRIAVGIVGITGYTGMELIRLLHGHGSFDLSLVTSRQEAGKELQDIFPQFQGHPEGKLSITEPDTRHIAEYCSLVFLATPAGTSMKMVPELLQQGVKVIDFSADFRLKSPQEYEKWYKTTHICPEAISRAVYGIPELYAERIQGADLVANPGCYPTSVILALNPALRENIVDSRDIVIDSKSGATGAGRSLKLDFLFCEANDSFKAYGLGKHRHTPEIEQELTAISRQEGITVSFNPHLLPINRGIISTVYTRVTKELTLQEIHRIYSKTYTDSPWVRILPPEQLPQTKHVKGTMFCDIGLVLDPRTNRLIIVSAIDNLCRGASGQALASANLMNNLQISEGLDLPPLTP